MIRCLPAAACLQVCSARELRLIQNQQQLLDPHITLRCTPASTPAPATTSPAVAATGVRQ